MTGSCWTQTSWTSDAWAAGSWMTAVIRKLKAAMGLYMYLTNPTNAED